MIHIRRPQGGPAVLLEKGKKARRALCTAYTRSPQAYRDGSKKFDKFDARIYSHRTVKQALLEAQHGKCCFCESKVAHIAYGDVEHFRPKAGYRQESADPLGLPGYYWLAYEWTNLLFACQLCNQRFKANLFPLRDTSQRAICHHDDLRKEEPLFVDPSEVSTELHITFRDEEVCAVNNSLAGRTTIEALQLNRKELRARRSELLGYLRCIHQTALVASPPLRDEARRLLELATDDAAEYAAMVRAAIAAALQTTVNEGDP